MTDFFQDWGNKRNPIRQSDLVTLFGSMFGCAKKFAMSKLYPRDHNKIGYKGVFGELLHDGLANVLMYDKTDDIPVLLERFKDTHSDQSIDYGKTTQSKAVEEYQEMLQIILDSKEFASVKKRAVEVERAFMVKIGKFWVAGTVDVIIRGKKKGSLVVLDWKTGSLLSQYEMDNGYQSTIYCHAVEKGEFFLKPETMSSGLAYYNSYQKTHQKNIFGVWPGFWFAQLKDIMPAKKKTKREAKHKSAMAMANDEGFIHAEKGERKGPVFYEASPRRENVKRLEHSIKCAVAFSRSGLFPESFGANCKNCSYNVRCQNLAMNLEDKQEVLAMMDELGIEPD